MPSTTILYYSCITVTEFLGSRHIVCNTTSNTGIYLSTIVLNGMREGSLNLPLNLFSLTELNNMKLPD